MTLKVKRGMYLLRSQQQFFKTIIINIFIDNSTINYHVIYQYLFFGETWVKVITDPKKQQRKIRHMHSGADGSLESESTGGHSRLNKTRQKVTRHYYWKGMTEDIKEFIGMCDRCQRKKTAENSSDNEKYSKIFSQIGIDLVTMVEAQGHKYILTICDFFTKWPELIPIHDKKQQQ